MVSDFLYDRGMGEKEILLQNIGKIHTTELGEERLIKNLSLKNTNPVAFAKKFVLKEKTHVYRKGKNFYCELSGIRLTINAMTYTIITGHRY